MRNCLIDLRCLQDPGYQERGIGRHARTLLSHARAFMPRTEMVGITDMGLPQLPPSVGVMVDTIRSTAYTGSMSEACSFVQLSPMTHDPLFVGRLLHHPAIPAATAFYDFIPLDDPDQYLGTAADRLSYSTALRWLARYDLFMPISQDAANGLKTKLGLCDERIAVTGAPLAPAFEQLEPGEGRHVLVVAGNDPRKNPECAIKAHARSRRMQAGRIPLIVTGSYGSDWLAAQSAAIEQLGGDASLLVVPGHVDEAQLLSLYAEAFCIVAPSRAEGFSLPVIEAMAAGKPVLASSIPAHRELLTTGLFDPDDDQALSALLDLVTDPAWCAASLGCQASVWPRFRAIAVAQRFWSSVDRLRPVVPPCTSGSRVKVAFLTPLPPDQSGVADYSAAACRELGANTELHLFSPTAQAKTPEGATTVSPLSLYPFLSSKFDRVVAVLGNSVFHIDILRMVLRYGGAVILHDGRMLDLYAGHIDFEKTVTMAERELGRPLRPNEIWSWLAGDTAPEALILSEVAGVAEPLMMHSRTAIADVGRRYGKEAIHLPFSLQRTIGEQHLTPDGRLAARKRLGVPETEVLIATFGYVHPTKAPLECLWALVLLRSWGINARLHFVGASIMPLDALDKTIADRGLAEHVRMPTEFVDEETYRDHLVGADVALQLRYGSTGSVSGSVSDCIAAGLRTVASAGLANAVDAPDFVVRVSDNPSPVLVAEAIAASLNYRDTTRERLGYIKAHGFDSYTNKLCIALNIR